MFKLLGKMLTNLANQPSYSVPVSNQIQTQNELIEIQLLDHSGNWRTFHVTQNVSAMVNAGMQQLSRQYPDHRIRAVNNGRIVDML